MVGQPDDPVHYTGLMPPGGLLGILFRESEQVDPRAVAIRSLKRGYRLASGDVPKIQDYVRGLKAYDVLAKNLIEEPHDENSYHGYSYTIACLQESKWGISECLKRLEKTLEVDLSTAIKSYEKVHELVNECQKLSPFSMRGNLDPELCQNSANILISAKEYEAHALKSLASILLKL